MDWDPLLGGETSRGSAGGPSDANRRDRNEQATARKSVKRAKTNFPGFDDLVLEQLLQNTHWLRQLARRFVADENRVDDLVQQTWIQAWKSPPETDRPVRPWLGTVVRNLIHIEHRSERRRQRRERLAAKGEAVAAPVDELELQEFQHKVADIVFALDEPYRSTLIRRFFLEEETDEIARSEGVKANTVRVRTKRALSQLAADLDDETGGERKHWLPLMMFMATGSVPCSSGGGGGAVSPSFPTTSSTQTSPKGGTGKVSRRFGSPSRNAAVVVLLCAGVGLLWWWTLSGSHFPTPDARPSAGEASPPEAASLRRASEPAPSHAATALHGPPPQTVVLPGPGQAVLIVSDQITGQPIEGAELSLRRTTMRSEDLARGNTAADLLVRPFCSERLGISDAAGIILAPRQRLRTDRMLVRAEGYQEFRERARLRDEETFRVELAPARLATVRVTGRDDLALSDAEVRVEGSQGSVKHGVTNRSGEVSFDWQDSDHAIVAAAPGHATARMLGSFPVSKLALVQGAVAKGVVVGPFGPVDRCSIAIQGGTWHGRAWSTESDAQGRFETLALPLRGTVSVRCEHPDYPPFTSRVSLPWDQERVFTLALGSFVSGVVVDPFGERATTGQVLLVPKRGRFRGRDLVRASIDSEGQFRLGPAGSGEYLLCVEHPVHGDALHEIEPLTKDTVLDIPLRLGHGSDVSGRVLTPDGLPVAGARIQVGWICGDELRGPLAETGPDGRFELSGIPRVAPVSRPANRDLRWTAALGPNASEIRAALVLELLRPFDLLSKNQEAIPRYRTFGSRNTCEVTLGETGIELVVAPLEAKRPPKFLLTGLDGDPLRTVTNLFIVSPTDPREDSQVIFGGTSGNPAKLHDPSAFAGCLVVFLSRSHAIGLIQMGNEPYLEEILVPLEELRSPALVLRLSDSHGQPAKDLPVLATPLFEGSAEFAGLLLGRTDGAGRLDLQALPTGDYRLSLAEEPTRVAGARPLATALPTEELLPIGVVMIDDTSQELQLTIPLEIEKSLPERNSSP